MATRNKKRPGSGRFPIALLDNGKPPHPHGDKYGVGACDCALCSEWYRRLLVHAETTRIAKEHGGCGCVTCSSTRLTLMDLMVVENIRDIWSELSWAASTEGWNPLWQDWIMEEFADPERSVGWWASQAAHHPMKYWYVRWDVWRKRLLE